MGLRRIGRTRYAGEKEFRQQKPKSTTNLNGKIRRFIAIPRLVYIVVLAEDKTFYINE